MSIVAGVSDWCFVVFWRFLIPLCFFVFSYWKIISAHFEAAPKSHTTVTEHSRPSTSTADTAAASSRSTPLSKTERNVIRTILIVISCFSACWLPFQFTLVIVVANNLCLAYRITYSRWSLQPPLVRTRSSMPMVCSSMPPGPSQPVAMTHGVDWSADRINFERLATLNRECYTWLPNGNTSVWGGGHISQNST